MGGAGVPGCCYALSWTLEVTVLSQGSLFKSFRLPGGDATAESALVPVNALIDQPAVRERVLLLRTAHPEHRILRQAVRLVAEARLCCRLAAYTARGCSADAGLLVQWLGEQWPVHEQVAESTCVLAALATPCARRKAFLKRFRRFWHVDYGRLRCRADVPPELQKDRVPWIMKLLLRVCPGQLCELNKVPNVDPICVPNVGTRIIISKQTVPIFGSQLWTRICEPLWCSSFDPGHTHVQVAVFLQWIQWLYLAVLRGADTVVVNIYRAAFNQGHGPAVRLQMVSSEKTKIPRTCSNCQSRDPEPCHTAGLCDS